MAAPAPPDGSGSRLLAFPAGGHGRMLAPGGLTSQLAEFPAWVGLELVADPLADIAGSPPAVPGDPAVEDVLLSVWTGPFAWAVIAEPVPSDELARLADEAASTERAHRSRAGSSPEAAVAAQRSRSRHQELKGGESTGAWRIALAAGGTDEVAAHQVAALLSASLDLSGLPYALRPLPRPTTFAALPWVSGVAGSAALGALSPMPRRELPGVRMAVRPDFDVVPETDGGAALHLGTVLDRNEQAAGPVTVPVSSLNRHTFVCGATGAGKSHTVRHLLGSAAGAGLPWLVIEPAKAEYGAVTAGLPDGSGVVVVRPGAPGQVPVGIDPLVPEPGFPLQTHVDLVRALFLASFQAEEPFPQVLSAALARVYEELGWDLALGTTRGAAAEPRYPTLRDLHRAALSVVDDIGYSREIRDNIHGFVNVRLSSLRLGTTGRFLGGGYPLDMARLLRQPTVLEIEDVGDDQDKAFLMGTVLIRLIEHLRVHRAGSRTLRHLTVIEEAHRLLRHHDRPGPAGQAVEMFAGLLAEIRAYGEGLVIAEQIPEKIISDVVRNTAVKIVHRLPAQDDRDTVGATMNVTPEQSGFLVTLRPGTAAVFVDGMDRPVLTRVPEAAGAGLDQRPAPPECLLDRTAFVGDGPATLEQLVRARHLIEDDPSLRLWAELAVAAHVTGRRTPEPGRVMWERLLAHDVDLLWLALHQAVAEAVETRGTGLCRRVSPAPLIEHVRDVLVAVLADAAPDCPDEEWEWLAPVYEFAYVCPRLDRWCGDDPDGRRHPASAEWESRLGTVVPGATARDQRRWVAEEYERRQRGSAAKRVLLGQDRPSAIEKIAGVDWDRPEWPDRCRAAVRELTGTESILAVLEAGRKE
jgi:DNA helicase HerA-like ATPase